MLKLDDHSLACRGLLVVGERIMKFVQCPADVSELELIRHSRDQRASLRAKGLQVTRALIAAAASPPSKVIRLLYVLRVSNEDNWKRSSRWDDEIL